ncbi:MAG: TldD/PmbA family protein [Candidatus Eremiobacteraeota bacterium]|nr:TldD/PmbA family protein [Candidatus Eremiobacteraeota bacterium]
MAEDGLEFAERIVGDAIAAGASQAEATYTVTERFSAEARGDALTKLERSVGRSLALRVFRDGRKASLTSSDLSPDALRRFVREAVEAAAFVAADLHAGLPEPVAVPPLAHDLRTYADDVRERSAEAKIADALALETGIRRADARIANSRGSHVADGAAEIAIANSNGFRGTFRATTASLDTSPIAVSGDEKRVAQFGNAAHGYARLVPVDAIAREAAERAAGMCGARKPKTTKCAVIFERDVAALVLGDIFAALNAANVAIGNSFFAAKIGARVGSSLARFVDDGRLVDGMGSSPFDSEGMPTQRTEVIREGVLQTFLYDTYYARRLGAKSTGNAAGGGSIGPSNFFLVPGQASLEDLIASTERGVLVLDTIGFATESVTGTYSRGARGFAIENGERAYPIDEFTIAGNILEMLGGLDAVANDMIFDSSIVSPSFRVAEMAIAGT